MLGFGVWKRSKGRVELTLFLRNISHILELPFLRLFISTRALITSLNYITQYWLLLASWRFNKWRRLTDSIPVKFFLLSYWLLLSYSWLKNFFDGLHIFRNEIISVLKLLLIVFILLNKTLQALDTALLSLLLTHHI